MTRKLTDIEVRNARPRSKPYKLSDERGMYLEVAPRGGKWWRFKYRFDGKEKRLSLGVYPDVSLKQARERREELRKLVANDIDPSQLRKARRRARANAPPEPPRKLTDRQLWWAAEELEAVHRHIWRLAKGEAADAGEVAYDACLRLSHLCRLLLRGQELPLGDIAARGGERVI